MNWEVREKKKTMKTNFKLKIEEAIQSIVYADESMNVWAEWGIGITAHA